MATAPSPAIALTLRKNINRPLTWSEADANFENLALATQQGVVAAIAGAQEASAEAQAAAAAAQQTAAEINNRDYPGSYASPPATRPDGSPPQLGDTYYSSTLNVKQTYGISGWFTPDVDSAQLASAFGTDFVGFDGVALHDALAGHAVAKAILLSGAAPLSIVPRLPGPSSAQFAAFGGAGAFTYGVMMQVDSFANSPGIIGGDGGSLGLRFDTTGRVNASRVSVADVGMTTNAARVGGMSFVMYSATAAGQNQLSINAIAGLTFNGTPAFDGSTNWLGSPDGTNAFLQGRIAFAFVSTKAMTLEDARGIMARGGLTDVQAQSCVFATGDSHGGMPLVWPSKPTVAQAFSSSYGQPAVVLPRTARIMGLPLAPAPISRLPRFGIAYFIGDSQTWGFNASGNTYYTDVSAQRKWPEYRWTDIYALEGNRNLTVTNLAITGSGFQWVPGEPASNAAAWGPHFYRTALIPKDWQGQIIFTPGWNNIGGGSLLTPDALGLFRRGAEALIAKVLLDDFGGMGTEGRQSTYASGGISGWSTTGTSGDQTVTGLTDASNPFPSAGAPSNALVRKVNLAPGQYVEFDVLAIGAKGRYALFVEAASDGGAFTVTQAGTSIIVDTCKTDQPGQTPIVNWIKNPTQGAKLRLTNTGAAGTVVRWLAAGWKLADAGLVKDRTIVMCTTSGNLTGRLEANVQAAARQAYAAAQTFGDEAVLFCDFADGWQFNDYDRQDPNHLVPSCDYRMARTLPTAVPVSMRLPSYCVSF